MKKILLASALLLGLGTALIAANTSSPITGLSFDSVRNVIRFMTSAGEEANVPVVDSGSGALAQSSLTNLTAGTVVFSKMNWTRVGKTVFAHFYVSGYSITAANAGTRLVLTSTGYPRPNTNDVSFGVCEGYRGGTDWVSFSVSMQSSGGIVVSGHSGSGTGTIDIGCNLIIDQAAN